MLFALTVAADNERGPQYMEQVLAAMHQANPDRLPLDFLFAQRDRTVAIFCRVPAELSTILTAQLAAHYPTATLTRLPGHALGVPEEFLSWSADLRLTPDIFPIRRYAQFDDPLNRNVSDPLTAIFASLAPDSQAQTIPLVALTIRPAPARRIRRARRVIHRLSHPFFRSHPRLARLYAAGSASSSLFVRLLTRILAACTPRPMDLSPSAQLTTTPGRAHDREEDLQAAADKVARHLFEVSLRLKEIQKADLKRRFDRPKLKHLRQIAIDEISTAKGHVYLTIVLDLESGAVVHVGRGKGGDALEEFWTRLRRSRAKIEAVATDMSPAYIDAVTTHLPGARLVFDRFHVIKLYNDKLSELRRALYHQLQDTLQKNVLKGTRWLLLKRPENLDPTRKEPQRLQEALRLNAPLATAYYLKEELSEIWEQEDEEAAEALLMDWITYAESTGIRILHSFAKTLRLHALGILSYYDHPISTGPLEGTNNKIKTMKRQAYGFRVAVHGVTECDYTAADVAQKEDR